MTHLAKAFGRTEQSMVAAWGHPQTFPFLPNFFTQTYAECTLEPVTLSRTRKALLMYGSYC